MSFGIVLVSLTVLATAVLSAWRIREVLFRENVDGDALLAGLIPHLQAGRRDAVIAACTELSGTCVAEVIRAAVEAAPAGPEAVEQALDEAQLEWLPDRENPRGLFGTLARVSPAIGMLGSAIEIRAALAQETGVLPLTPIVLTMGGGILGVIIALYGRGLVSRTVDRIRDETGRAVRKLPGLLASPAEPLELSSAPNDSM